MDLDTRYNAQDKKKIYGRLYLMPCLYMGFSYENECQLILPVHSVERILKLLTISSATVSLQEGSGAYLVIIGGYHARTLNKDKYAFHN